MHWQELLPADSYLVSSAGLLHDYDRKILTRLYQPLIGPICISLYMTLWSELEEKQAMVGNLLTLSINEYNRP